MRSDRPLKVAAEFLPRLVVSTVLRAINELSNALCFSPPQKQTPGQLARVGGLGNELDDDLLSHGETPHYHRRCVVSLLSSGRDQVVPTLYGRQAIQLLPRGLAAAANWVCDRTGIACSCRFSVCLSTYRLTAKLFGCYMVKPHGQLVWVSSTPHSAYTPHLSTS